ncbi:MAG: DUF4290 domain-containing protein [Bacteroidetes bacterium]|nr:MAG: DUF4290 domain-containing protein [Bacteroidota bacterium]TNE99687.1 MAG: DUF4290 domain-containing protein [Bacteroidota bacterium]
MEEIIIAPEMQYNTSRGKMLLPEYGRNVQNMIRHAMEIEDRNERNRAALAIIEVMGQLNPHLRDVDDYRHKLWTHLFIMSDFQLDVDSPYEKPKREVLEEKPNQMPYPKSRIRYGHYGQYTQRILESAKEMSEEEKDYIKDKMGNFMKKQFLVHNNNTVENHVIAQQMKELSHGVLQIENPDEDLTSTNQMLRSLGLNNNNNNKNTGRRPNRNKKNQKKYKK